MRSSSNRGLRCDERGDEDGRCVKQEEDAVPSLFRRWSSCPMLDRFHESADRAASLDSSGRGTKVRRVDVLAVGESQS